LSSVLGWPTALTSAAAARRCTLVQVQDPLPHMASVHVPGPEIQYRHGLPQQAWQRQAVCVPVRTGQAGCGLANVEKGVLLGVIAAS
jgi:hypothetical protein